MTDSSVVARRLPVVGPLNSGKSQVLAVMGDELDRVRSRVWSRFSGAKTAHLSKRQVRDRLMAEHAAPDFGEPQRCGGPPWRTPWTRSGPGNAR